MGWIINGKYQPDIIRPGFNGNIINNTIGGNVKVEPKDKATIKDVEKSNTIDSRINFGHDDDGRWVRYDKSVSDDKKIVGLCRFLEIEYLEFIIPFAIDLLGEDKRFEYGNKHFLLEFPRIPVILKDKIKYDHYHTDKEKIAEIIYKKTTNKDNKFLEQDILQILKKEDYYLARGGEYFGKNITWLKKQYNYWRNYNQLPWDEYQGPYIVIYYNAHNQSDISYFEASLAQCLAHEYFHFVHHLFTVSKFNTKGHDAKCVRESLADFFSLLYLLETKGSNNSILGVGRPKKEDFALDRYNFWQEYFDFDLPYAYALYFYILPHIINPYSYDYRYYEANGSIDKFYKVFSISQWSFEEAYEKLLNK